MHTDAVFWIAQYIIDIAILINIFLVSRMR
jgi:hypothetical protein